MKFSYQLVASSLAVVILSACSTTPAERRQARDSFEYLETPQLMSDWQQPEGLKSQPYPNYVIPDGSYSGGLGKAIDIRPPQQVLSLIAGSRAIRTDDDVTLWLVKQDDSDKIWQTLEKWLADNKVKILQQQTDQIETDWVNWARADEDTVVSSRYQITRLSASNRFGIKVTLVDWREGSDVKAISKSNRERYNVLMANTIITQYDQDERASAQLRAQQSTTYISISMGSDRSGLPIIIARSPYSTFWQRFPTLLPEMGFVIEDRNQSQGIIKVKYTSPSESFWKSIDMRPIALPNGSYTFLLGDLSSRTSINVMDSATKPIDEAVLTSLSSVISSVIERQ